VSALRRVPAAAWACAAVALANGLVWSLIVPPFEVPDENAHYAYVQQLVERGALPHTIAHEGSLSPAEDGILAAIGFYVMVGERANPAPFTQPQQQAIEAVTDAHLSAVDTGSALSATANPPLYYLLQAVPFALAPGGVLDRLAAMRALSAVLGAVTVLLIFLFLRELLPRRPLAWTAGALVAALQPLFGFMSGGVNNDDLVYLLAAGMLWGLARAFRRGLTPATGALLGGFLGAALVTKFTLLSFIPAVAVALVLLLRRAWAGGDRAAAARGAGVAAGLAAAPLLAYAALCHLVWHRPVIPGGVGGVPTSGGRAFDFRQELSHVWQLFLPHLWMHPQFSYFPLWKTWFKGLVGRFGWLDYTFPQWVYVVALVLALVLLALAAGELVRRRRTVWRRLDELVVYALVAVGLCAEIGAQSYRYLIATGGQFEQARYLLPLLGLYAALVALAVRCGGRRYGPALAAAALVLAVGHDVFAQMLTISRYYS
jgi:4-amino-4-deoxy-L-arabinose transferase-like glycosyltransferase